MQDRVPLYPGRVKLTPVAGQENVYDMVRADQPTQEGTPLNKNSLLKDATAALFQLSGDTALPDKVFEILSKAALVGEDGGLVTTGGNTVKVPDLVIGEYTGTGKYGEGNKNTLSADFDIKLVVVHGHSPHGNKFLVVPYGTNEAESAPGSGGYVSISWSGNAISWYARHPDEQLNSSGTKFSYALLGDGT